MKKLCLISVLLIMMMSSGCTDNNTSQKQQKSPPSVYSSDIDVTFGDIKMSAVLTKHSPQKYEIDFSTPESINPLSLLYENGVCTVTYDGLTFESDINRFPHSEFGALLTRALDDIDNGSLTTVSDENGNIIYKGITDHGDFALIQDNETGLWKEFTVDGTALKVIFSNYKTN